MTSATGSKGFTLIEVLVAVLLLSVGLVWIVEGYGSVLNITKKAKGLMDGGLLLHEKMADQELKIRTGGDWEGRMGGQEGPWEWSTEVKEKENGYELQGEVHRQGNEISLITYVQKQRIYPH